jgi:hypothetical protein
MTSRCRCRNRRDGATTQHAASLPWCAVPRAGRPRVLRPSSTPPKCAHSRQTAEHSLNRFPGARRTRSGSSRPAPRPVRESRRHRCRPSASSGSADGRRCRGRTASARTAHLRDGAEAVIDRHQRAPRKMITTLGNGALFFPSPNFTRPFRNRTSTPGRGCFVERPRRARATSGYRCATGRGRRPCSPLSASALRPSR